MMMVRTSNRTLSTKTLQKDKAAAGVALHEEASQPLLNLNGNTAKDKAAAGGALHEDASQSLLKVKAAQGHASHINVDGKDDDGTDKQQDAFNEYTAKDKAAAGVALHCKG